MGVVLSALHQRAAGLDDGVRGVKIRGFKVPVGERVGPDKGAQAGALSPFGPENGAYSIFNYRDPKLALVRVG